VLRTLLLENESNKNRIEVILHPKILKIMQEWQKNSKKILKFIQILDQHPSALFNEFI
jgi:uncharacterized protein (DUF924 family)